MYKNKYFRLLGFRLDNFMQYAIFYCGDFFVVQVRIDTTYKSLKTVYKKGL